MSKIIIEYMPALSPKTKSKIAKNLTPDMICPHGYTNQYPIEQVIGLVEQDVDAQDDLELLSSLLADNVSFIEF